MNNEQNAETAVRHPGADGHGQGRAGGIPFYRRKRVIIPALTAVAGLLVVVSYWFVSLRNFVSTDDAYIDADRASISAKMIGRIVKLSSDEGDTVHPGQELVQLDDTDLRAQRSQAKANLALAQNSITLSRVGLERNREDYARVAGLFNDGHSTQEQFDHARKSVEAAQADLAIAQSKASAAAAQLDVVDAQLGNMTMTAPFGGVVAKRWAMTGEVVQPAQPILTIYDRSRLWVTANLEETNIRQIKLGDHVEISVDAVPERILRGTVSQIGGYTSAQFSLIPPNNAAGNFTKVTQRIPVKIALDQAGDGRLSPGMSVEIKIRIR